MKQNYLSYFKRLVCCFTDLQRRCRKR